jgi:hypothetical protein
MNNSSRSWRSEMMVLAGLVPSEGCEGGPARFVSDPLFTLSPYCLPCVCVCAQIPSYKDTHHIELGPT